MSPLVKRIIASLGANAFAQGGMVFMQLMSLPLFLGKWDASTYGVWLMLTAIPSYLSMADVGMVNVAGNRMTMAMGQGDVATASRIFQSAQVFVICTCGALALIALPVILLIPIPGLTSRDHQNALTALTCGTLVLLFAGLSDALFRATGRYAFGTTLSNTLRLLEWAAGVGGLYLWGTFSAVAFMSLIVRIIGVIIIAFIAGKKSDGLSWGVHLASMSEVRAMVHPALSFMAFPITNALTFQGGTLLVGHLLGPATVTIFNTYRTLARVAVQLTGIFSFALWAEFSRLFGKGGAAAVVPIYKKSSALGAAIAVAVSLLLYIFGPWLLNAWTHGAIAYDSNLMIILLAYAAAGGIQHVSRVLLMSTNHHMGIAQWAVASSVMMLLLGALLAKPMGVRGVGVAMLLAESVMTGVCLMLSYRLLNLTLFGIRRSLA